MTLIAFHATDKSAHLMTDSVTYTTYCEELGHATKRAPIDHLDATIATQGDTTWGDTVVALLLTYSTRATTFDDLVDQAPRAARGCRDGLATDANGYDAGEGFVVLLGWSHRLGRFAGYVLHSRNDYEAREHDGLFVYPSPWTARPTREQLDSFREWEDDDANRDKVVELWQAKPILEPPADDAEWVDLAKRVRTERSAEPYAKVLVAGSVYLTKIKRGFQSTRKVHQFNDRGEEWVKVLSGTRHPIGLAAPCPCGSGERVADCHGRKGDSQAQETHTLAK